MRAALYFTKNNNIRGYDRFVTKTDKKIKKKKCGSGIETFGNGAEVGEERKL